MTQKVLKVGSSAAVTIPKKSLEELGLKIGDDVMIEINRKQRTVLIEPVKSQPDKELLEWTRRFIARYKTALKALADK